MGWVACTLESRIIGGVGIIGRGRLDGVEKIVEAVS